MDVLLIVNHFNHFNTSKAASTASTFSGEPSPMEWLSDGALEVADRQRLDEQSLMAQQDLSQQLKVTLSEIRVESARRMTWRDTSLEAGVLVGQALTQGAGLGDSLLDTIGSANMDVKKQTSCLRLRSTPL